MFKKTMTFDDLEGNEVQQTFYFNYNKKEIAELLEFGYITEFPPPPGEKRLPLEETLAKLSTSIEESGLTELENTKQAYDIIQGLVLDAYGVKGEDNVTFDKTVALRNYWKSHVAFVELVFELLGAPKLITEFVESCLPAKAVASVKAELAAQAGTTVTDQSLTDMVAEAERRQQDPATAVQPGPAPLVAVDDQQVKAKPVAELTEQDILDMDAVAFAKLDVSKLTKKQMMAAFKRKAQG